MLLLCGLSVLPAAAQVRGGIISGIVKDQQGGVLPGTSVTAQGVDAALTLTTSADGAFHFLDLAPGPYKITALLPGFTTLVRDNVIVEVGRTIDLPIALRVASVSETVIVTAAPPMVNATPTGTSVNFTNSELTGIPTSRDPFALIRTVPGALTDRVNIGGNETGQQLLVVAKGARQQDTSWTLDGVEITDMAAAGQSATYFNFDNFDEVHVSTAGNDIRQRTGGLNVDLIVKRGANRFHGEARGYFTDEHFQAANIPAELTALAKPVTTATADRLTRNSDYGFDFGGPAWKDRAWFYGSYSTQNVQVYRRTTSAIDRTTLNDPNVKVNVQATKKDLVTFLWYNGYKIKDNRAPGATAIEQSAATWHQDNHYSSAPFHGLWKVGDDRLFGTHLFMSAKYAYFNTGISLTPEGGMDAQAGRNNVTSTGYGSFQRQISARPQHTATVDMNSFFGAGGASHHVKYGLGYRTVDVFTENLWPGNGILAVTQSSSDLRAQVFREGNGGNRADYLDFYVGDTISRDRLTLDVALRYDRQSGRADPSTSQGNVLFPTLLPGIVFPGYDAPFTWNTISPRAGINYALDESGKTVARVTYSRFAGQLSTTSVGFANVASGLGSITYRWTDLNSNGLVDGANEVNTAMQIGAASGINAANPALPVSPNVIDPNLKAPMTQSVVGGLERELRPNVAVQVNYTYSRTSNLFGNEAANITSRVGVGRGDYAPGNLTVGGQTAYAGAYPGTFSGTLPDGTRFSIPVFNANAAKFAASGGGFVLANVPGYYVDYHGVELGLVKRLADKWMGRLSFSYNNAREHFESDAGRYDTNGNPMPTVTEPLIDGGQFVSATGTGTGAYYMNAKWQFNLNGMYQAPYGIELAANVFGRQGYPFPLFATSSVGATATALETLRVLVTPKIDTYRYPNVWDTDVRIARQFKFGNLSMKVMGDVFNLLNANTALLRVNDVSSSTFNTLQQNLTPRILRFGVTMGF